MSDRDYLVTFRVPWRERKRILEWLRDEWHDYADSKFDHATDRPAHDERLRDEGIGPDAFWRLQVFQYVQRAHVLGLDTARGRQALIKGWAAYGGLLESMVRVYGDPPPAGVASGVVASVVGPLSPKGRT